MEVQIFTRKKSVSVDLGDLSLTKIMSFPEKRKAGLQEFYIKRIVNKNHIQIGKQSRVYGGIHEFKYDQNEKRVYIFSRFKKSAFGLYGYLIMPLIPFIFGGTESGSNLKLLRITIALFIVLSLVLIIGIKSESREIEREMILRINYFRKK